MYTPGTIANSQTKRLPTKTKILLLPNYIRILVELGIGIFVAMGDTG